MDIEKKLHKIIPQIPSIRETEYETNPKAYLKFFNILGRGEWYVTELEVEENDILMFGYVKSPLGADCDEFGYFTLNQIKEVPAIELDLYFEPCKIKEVMT